MLRKLLPFLAFLVFAGTAFSQVNVKDSSVFTPLIYATYAYQIPQGDLAERFGGNSSIGGGLLLKTSSNWIFGGEGNYLFGGTVKNSDSILKALETSEGYMVNQNGYIGDVLFSERGFNISGKIGKLFPVLSPNPNSGITILAGGGYMQNKIRIHAIESTLPSIEGDYRKGYDKLNGGFFISGSVGYTLMSSSRLLNFYVGAEIMQAWTKSLRDYDFSTQKKDNKAYNSQFIGIRVKWMIPFYKRKPKEFYLY